MSVTVGGTTRVCVEPSVSSDHCVARADVNELLVFPHVDTCVALLFILEGGKLVGGHASRGDIGDKAVFRSAFKNLGRIVVAMGEKLDAKVVGVVAFGQFDPDAVSDNCWKWIKAEQIIRETVGHDSIAIHRIDTSNAANGVDIFADPGTRVIEVQRYQSEAKRGPLDPPTRRPSPPLVRKFDSLSGGALAALVTDV